MDAYLVKDSGPVNDEDDDDYNSVASHPAHDGDDGEVTGDEGDGELFDLENLRDDASEYLSTIQRMAPVAGLKADFDPESLEGKSCNKPIYKLLVDALAKVFKGNRAVETLNRRAESMQANVDRLQHVRVTLEHEQIKLDKDKARLESLLQQQKLEFQRDTQQLRQEMKEVRLANTQMKSLRGQHKAKIRALELQMGKLKDNLSRQLQQKDRKIRSGLALTSKLQAACFVKSGAPSTSRNRGTTADAEGNSRGSGSTKRKAGSATTEATSEKTTADENIIANISARALRAQNKRLAAANQRLSSFCTRLAETIDMDDASPAYLFAAHSANDAVATTSLSDFEEAILTRLKNGDADTAHREPEAEAADQHQGAAANAGAVSSSVPVQDTSNEDSSSSALRDELDTLKAELAQAQAIIEEQNVLIRGRLLADEDGEVAQAVDESSIDDEDDSLLALQKEQYFADRERFNALRQKLEQQQRDLYDNLLRSTGRKLKRGRLGATPSPFMAARSATRAVKVSSAGAGASKSDHKENDDAISNGRRGDSVQVSPIACNLDESLDKVSPANADVSADFQPVTPGTAQMLRQLEQSDFDTPGRE